MCEWGEDHKSDLCIRELIFGWARKLLIKTRRRGTNFRDGASPLMK